MKVTTERQKKLRYAGKIFGIGLGRTGTHSLAVALSQLGIKIRHHVNYNSLIPEFCLATRTFTGSRLFAMFDKYQAVANGTGLSYRELDLAYPNSRFILTVREPNAWLQSQAAYRRLQSEQARDSATHRVQHFINREIYGSEHFDPEIWLETYKRHVDSVLDYFADRSMSLLVMDICGGDGWDKICPFLGCAVPSCPFPHTNDITAVTKRAKLFRLIPPALSIGIAKVVNRTRMKSD